MKVGAVIVKKDGFNFSISKDELLNKILLILIKSYKEGLDVIVFPGLFGCLFENDRDYIEKILRMSINFKNIAICPGSYFENAENKTYHSSCIIQNGRILLRQRQLYLAKWEKDLGLSRGENISFVNLKGFKIALLISTDTFYPQVSRYIAMSGADLVLSPVSIYGKTFSYQMSALWQNVQQNLFFGVESGLKGNFDGKDFYSLSIIHAPLEMTERENGILEIERNNYSSIIMAQLDNEKRKEAIKKFNVLSHLNTKLYEDIFR
ncbi:carbon-nitrogen hydrolase family protein [Caloramator sp. E03]|uniref:carbon-nitrogen hydrolase family protein n=1 Tax=Caloramator sp. E03 TaxID=2576307 RepID=UPI001110FAAB|nr:carbon-nitrogen hydrolase family protein [Caloramator sp. E03]QCX33240.1 carbon-nitrogen hydrolase family protein [Caloramator sp. E03]